MQLTREQKAYLIRKIKAVFAWLGKDTEFGKRFINDKLQNELLKTKEYADYHWYELRMNTLIPSESFGHIFEYDTLKGKLKDSCSLLELITYAKQMLLDKVKLLEPDNDKQLINDVNECNTRIDQVNAILLELDADLHKQDASRREQETLDALKKLAESQKHLSEQFEKLLKNEDETSKYLKKISDNTAQSQSDYNGPSSFEMHAHFDKLSKTIAEHSGKLTNLLEAKEAKTGKSSSIFGKK